MPLLLLANGRSRWKSNFPATMAKPRLFLVAPVALSPDQILACATAACAAGDVASIIVASDVLQTITSKLQSLGLAVLANGNTDAKCDGVHLNGIDDDIAEARRILGKENIVGAFCAASRHAAMQAAEDCADYIAFSQNAYTPSEPIVGWWSDLFEIPCVAFDPVEIDKLDILLPQKPDFIRPSDAMWSSPEEARRIVSELMHRMA
jgi:thiamine-phosphate pyrophosphorylase